MSESESVRKTEHVPEWKQAEVEKLVAFLGEYDSVGIVDVTGIPSRQLQDMRRGLHGQAELRMSRNTLMERAVEEVDDGLEELTEYVDGQVGFIGTNDNPFGLYRQLEESKTAAPINAGEVAPNDIEPAAEEESTDEEETETEAPDDDDEDEDDEDDDGGAEGLGAMFG